MGEGSGEVGQEGYEILKSVGTLSLEDVWSIPVGDSDTVAAIMPF